MTNAARSVSSSWERSSSMWVFRGVVKVTSSAFTCVASTPRASRSGVGFLLWSARPVASRRRGARRRSRCVEQGEGRVERSARSIRFPHAFPPAPPHAPFSPPGAPFSLLHGGENRAFAPSNRARRPSSRARDTSNGVCDTSNGARGPSDGARRRATCECVAWNGARDAAALRAARGNPVRERAVLDSIQTALGASSCFRAPSAPITACSPSTSAAVAGVGEQHTCGDVQRHATRALRDAPDARTGFVPTDVLHAS